MIYVLSEVDIIHCTFSVHSVLSAVSTTAYLSFYTDFPTVFLHIPDPIKPVSLCGKDKPRVCHIQIRPIRFLHSWSSKLIEQCKDV